MNRTTSKKHTLTAVGLDMLLQDSYLLVVELGQGAPVQDGSIMWQRCVTLVEQVQQSLKDADVNTRSIELISHAQCALLDETVLGRAENEAHTKWASEPLQAKFFGRHQAGEFLYEDMREALRQPVPDLLVLTAFHRVLMLGFRGRYHQVNDPERERLLAALTAQVAPLELNQALTTLVAGRRMNPLRGLRSPLAHVLAASVLLVGAWWGLDHWLGGLVATLMSGQA